MYGTVVVSPNGAASAVTGDTFNSTCDPYYYAPNGGTPDYTITSETGTVYCNATGHWVDRNPCKGKILGINPQMLCSVPKTKMAENKLKNATNL